MPIAIPIAHVAVPISEIQMTNCAQNALCRRSGVKYSQCSTALR